MNNLLIRDADPDDMDRITEIYAHHILNGLASFEEIPPTVQDMGERFEATLASGLPYLVAEQNNIVMGYAYAGAYRARPAYRFSVENSVYVANDMQGKGIGSALLKATIDAFDDLDYNLMIAVIGDSGNKASIELHKRHGFEMVGILKKVGFKHNRWVDTVLMQLSLTKN